MDAGDRARPFSTRDASVLSTLSAANQVRLERRLATAQCIGRHRLSPRKRATLEAPLEGDSEQQVADRRAISAATVQTT